ncbi:MAG: phosphoribosylamine--glycine ligase [Bacteroidota bacterium]|jgi:phosphoribosylamine--glycine ligase
MKILLLGSGGREHAFAWKIAQSKLCTKLFIAPGNAGTMACGTNIAIKVSDFEAIEKFCVDEKIDLVLPGSEEPLVKGIYDYFQSKESLKHIPVIGPSTEGAKLEGSKAYAKKFMIRHQIPTAAYQEFDKNNLEEGFTYLENSSLPIVLKADGLAAGKGVVICETKEQAKAELAEMITAAKFGDASAKVVIEQFLKGIEMSVFVLTDGKNYLLLPTAKDYKRVGEGDKGLNTGGMGAISPVPFANKELMDKVIERVIEPTIKGLQQEKIVYKGFIYFGLICLTPTLSKGEGVNELEPFVIEYNCRMGDPETEVVIPRIENDLVELMNAVAAGKLDEQQLKENPLAGCTVVLASKGYPETFETGKLMNEISASENITVFHAGTKLNEDGKIISSGGRVMMLTALDTDLNTARELAISKASEGFFDNQYFRKDIGMDVIKK